MSRLVVGGVVAGLTLVIGVFPPAWASSSVGSWNIAVLMVDFSDNIGNANRADVNAELFGDHPPNAPYGSLRDYYAEVSYGQLTVSGQVNHGVTNWYRMPQPYSYYLINKGELLPDAVQAARTAGFNFGPLDGDNDGYVDAIFLVHAGTGQEFSGCGCDVWSFASANPTVDTGATNGLGNPILTGRYSVVPEWYGYVGNMTIGVFAHEFGHNLGLPDLYDQDGSSKGLGVWSLMAAGTWRGAYGSGPTHLDAWSKVALGWVNPIAPTSATRLVLPPIGGNPSIYKLYATPREYFLLENRQKTGFDATLPEPGLLIYHVDDFVQTGNRLEWYSGCTTCASHYQVAVVSADNFWDLERNTNDGDRGDPYPGTSNNTAFTDTSSPSSAPYLSTASGISVTNIQVLSDSTIEADLAVPPLTNLDFPVVRVPQLRGNHRVAFGGRDYMVVWNENRSGSNQIYGARVSPSGTTLDPGGILIGEGLYEDVAFDGTNWLVVWGHDGNVLATRLSPSGTVLDPTGINVLSGGTGYTPRLAFDGTNYMVVWLDYRLGSGDIYGARVAPSGMVLDPGSLALVTEPGEQASFQIAYGGGTYFLVWNRESGLVGSRITTDGTVLDPTGIGLSATGSSPSVVYQGSNFLTVWEQSGDVKGARVDSAGTLRDSPPLTFSPPTTTTTQGSPAVAFDGVNSLVVWVDSAFGIEGILVAPSGAVVTPPFALSTTASRVGTPALAAGEGRGLVVWTDWRNERSVPVCTLTGSCDVDPCAVAACDVYLYGNFTPTGPVAWYRLEETSGATVADASGHNNLGTNAGATSVAGKVGNAFSFNGTTAYVNVPNGLTSTIKGDDTHTITMWVYPRSITNNPVLLDAPGTGTTGLFLELGNAADRTYYWGYGGSYRTYSGTVLSVNAWHHLAFVRTGAGNSGTLYVDGVAQTSFTGTFGPTPNVTSNLFLGTYQASGVAFNGNLDEVKIYNRALSGTEVVAEAWVGLPTPYALTVTKAGTGSGTVTSIPAGITCDATCSAIYASGTEVALTAAPASGSTFAGWSGACTRTGTCLVTMTAAQAVFATFHRLPTYPLSVTTAGSGQGTVASSPPGILCGAICSTAYVSGTVVTLTATPASGASFGSWSGECTGTGACVVTLTAAQAVTAAFSSGTAPSSSLINISSRARVETGANVQIGGFIIGGATSKTVLLRARGPSLGSAPFNNPGVLANPSVQLYSGSTVIAQNDNWQTTDPRCGSPATACGNAAQITATAMDPCRPNPGQSVAPPNCTLESALLVTLPPGGYTAIVSGVDGGAGVGLVEVFEADTVTTSSRLTNISSRARVETGANVQIGGFIIGGVTSKTVLLRARGPSLGSAPFNNPGVLANPNMQLYSGSTVIAQNDNWQTTDPRCGSPATACGNAAQITATAMDPCRPNPGQPVAPPNCTLESALLVTLPPGGYTAIVSGVGGATGVGLVEVFEVP